MTKTGYASGSDMLLMIAGKCVGHCTTHNVSITSETKDRAVKPLQSEAISRRLWKNKGVTGLSVSISAEGLNFYEETESGYRTCLSKITTGQSVEVKCFERGLAGSSDPEPYLTGQFVVASLERTDPAADDSTYSISLENDGEVTFDASKLTDGSQPNTSE